MEAVVQAGDCLPFETSQTRTLASFERYEPAGWVSSEMSNVRIARTHVV